MYRVKKNPHSLTTQRHPKVKLIKLEKLMAHEEVDLRHLSELINEIESDRVLKFAIAVDKATRIILDGNHRFNALMKLECKRIPVVFVDYNTPQIRVRSWRNGWTVTKETVIEAGLSGKKLPPKTSKHVIITNRKFEHIFAIEIEVNFPLERLKL